MATLAGWDRRIKLIIDSAKIDVANQTNFPVLVHISASSGITSVDATCVFDEILDDANRKKIAVTTSDGVTECYVEIERWDTVSEEAWLWVKVPTVAHAADTDIYLYYDKDQADNTTHVGDTGSVVAQSVWDANFRLIHHFSSPETSGFSVLDSTSNANNGTPTDDPDWFTEYSLSNDLNCHQGVAFDGTHYYCIDTSVLRKFDAAWSEVATNSSPHTNIDGSTDHLGDGCCYDSKLYVVAEAYNHPCVSYSNQYITVWNTSNLSFISKHDISAQGMEIAGIAIDPDAGANGTLYVVSYCDGTKIWKYDLSDFSYLGAITLSSTINYIQGITKVDSFFYISEGATDSIQKVKNDGTVLGKVYTGASEAEGIESFDDKLILLIDTGADEKLHFLEPAGIINYGLEFDGTNYVDIGIGTNLNPGANSFTIESMFKSVNTGWRAIYSKRKAAVTSIISFRQGSSQTLGIYCKDSAANSKGLYTDDTVNDSAWHYGAAVRDGNDLYIILDLVTKSAAGLLNNIDVSAAKSICGMKGDGYTADYFDGSVDELRISDCVRSEPWRKATSYSNVDNLVTFGTEEILTSTNFFDGKLSISPATLSFDGKARIKNSSSDSLDGKAIVNNLATNYLDGKTYVTNTGQIIAVCPTPTCKISATFRYARIEAEPPVPTASFRVGKIIEGECPAPSFTCTAYLGRRPSLIATVATPTCSMRVGLSLSIGTDAPVPTCSIVADTHHLATVYGEVPCPLITCVADTENITIISASAPCPRGLFSITVGNVADIYGRAPCSTCSMLALTGTVVKLEGRVPVPGPLVRLYASLMNVSITLEGDTPVPTMTSSVLCSLPSLVLRHERGEVQ